MRPGILDSSEPEVRAQVIPCEVRLVDGTLRIDALVQGQNVQVTANGDKVTVASKRFGSMADVSFDRSEVVDILFNGSEGDDIFVSETGIDSIAVGRRGNDRLVGSSGNDDLFGGTGNDRLYGRGGVDLLLGRDGVDRLFEGEESDVISGNQAPASKTHSATGNGSPVNDPAAPTSSDEADDAASPNSEAGSAPVTEFPAAQSTTEDSKVEASNGQTVVTIGEAPARTGSLDWALPMRSVSIVAENGEAQVPLDRWESTFNAAIFQTATTNTLPTVIIKLIAG
ncbi:calcium-binding protein [Neorhodopirellula pilleata]|uniref:RTX-I toxin determinant A from serotypes 1/9 n=1 Tax=Neorhodopirellula pilleata TaxID=2714738 RepID=A0A5C5ZPP1_9BACT|nr:hypothetical protein [Neorhodopirellula pilleata]TWT89146.1 RTX-I toxin determinant A from serotypes 1/9 [Neorhodopirellula pilleata]